MKVLLIEPPFYLFQDIQPGSASLGLAMLAAMAERNGHEVTIYSPDFEHITECKSEDVVTVYTNVNEKVRIVEKRLTEIIESFEPQVVGISLWTARVKVGLELGSYVKRVNPDITLVGGGVHATILPEDILKSGAFDFLIRGEGEFAFASLLECLNTDRSPKEEKIDCLSFIDEDGCVINNPITYCENLDELPYPEYKHFINNEKFPKNSFRSVMFSRGCPFDCNYCASHKIWTRKTRFHTPSYIVKMIKYIHQEMGTDYFQFDDDTFTLRESTVREICKLIKEAEINIKWHCDTRVEFVTHSLLAEMQEVGLETVAMGVESGDINLRKIIRKTSSLETTKKAFKIASEMGINTRGYFMLGFPGETYEQASRTLDFIEEIKPTFPCISICIPYPGTDSFTQAVEMGTISDVDTIDWSLYYHHSNVDFSGSMNDAEWKSLLDRCSEIEREAKQRINKANLNATLNQITIGKVFHRYTKTPQHVFGDFKKLISLLSSVMNRHR